jgi:hypothetical protein
MILFFMPVVVECLPDITPAVIFWNASLLGAGNLFAKKQKSRFGIFVFWIAQD